MRDGDYIIFDFVSPLKELSKEIDKIKAKKGEKDGRKK